MDEDYHFAAQFTADLIAMNHTDFIITSTFQEIAGTEVRYASQLCTSSRTQHESCVTSAEKVIRAMQESMGQYEVGLYVTNISVHRCMLRISEGAVLRLCQSVSYCAGPLTLHPARSLQSH